MTASLSKFFGSFVFLVTVPMTKALAIVGKFNPIARED